MNTPQEKTPLQKGPETLFEKVWQQHLVVEPAGEPSILYIDLHLVHEVTSPQAFDGLRMTGRKLRRPDRTVATVDHNVPTSSIEDRLHIVDQIASKQIEALRKNCADFGVELYDVQSPNQGIVHIIGPELGLTKPGMTIVCGDSHTSTHGAFGALAFGIGTSEVEHVMATQTLPQDKPKTFRINIEGTLPNRGHRQRHRPPHHRPDRHRRSHRPRHRIRRLRHPQPLHGRPYDHLQHEHRGRSPRRHDRPRRHHLRLPQRPPLLAARSSMGRGCQALVRTCNRRRSNLRPRTDHCRHRHHSNRKLGHLARHGHRCQKHRSPARSPSL